MTRKDYVLLAAALNRVLNDPTSLLHSDPGEFKLGVRKAAESIADSLAGDNGRFDRERFLRAVEATGGWLSDRDRAKEAAKKAAGAAVRAAKL